MHSHLQPDSNDETAALLRVLIYKVDNTTFGDNPPTLPHWTGPPQTIVQVEAILFASLTLTLFSAFLAMLGKQWLNRYASTDVRGTAIERSQNRQRKLDGIVAWYFDHVMEALPLMLQVALLLLGCALSRYLWGVNTTVGSVVLGATSFGIMFYISIVVAGAVSESCPYQTPGSLGLRYLKPKAQRIVGSATSAMASAFGGALKESKVVRTTMTNAEWHHPWWSRRKIKLFLNDMVLEIPRALVIDTYHLGRVITRPLVAFPLGVYRLGSSMVVSLVSFGRAVRGVLHGTPHTPEQGPDQQTTELDVRCISWMLQTSLDKAVYLSTLRHFATMATLVSFSPTLVADCFDVFLGCITVSPNGREVVILQELEELAAVSALCFFTTVSHLLTTDPTSSVLEGVRQRYLKIFPTKADFHDHQSYHTVNAARCLLVRRPERPPFRWNGYKPSAHEHTIVAGNLLKLAQLREAKVPRLILRFALHSLALDPLPTSSVIADCLSIIAIDLGCDVTDAGNIPSDEKCVRVWSNKHLSDPGLVREWSKSQAW